MRATTDISLSRCFSFSNEDTRDFEVHLQQLTKFNQFHHNFKKKTLQKCKTFHENITLQLAIDLYA